VEEKNQSGKRELGPHGHRKAICEKCGPDAGEKELFGHNLCRVHYDERRHELQQKAQELTRDQVWGAYSAIVKGANKLRVLPGDKAKIREVLRPYIREIGDDIGLEPATPAKSTGEAADEQEEEGADSSPGPCQHGEAEGNRVATGDDESDRLSSVPSGKLADAGAIMAQVREKPPHAKGQRAAQAKGE